MANNAGLRIIGQILFVIFKALAIGYFAYAVLIAWIIYPDYWLLSLAVYVLAFWLVACPKRN